MNDITIGNVVSRRIGERTRLSDSKDYVAIGIPKDRDGDPRIAFRGSYDAAADYAGRNDSPDNYERYEVREIVYTLTVDMPGAMSTWWSGTGVVAGETYSDNAAENAGAEELARAWRERKVIRRGKGHSLRLTVNDPYALGVLADYAETLISINQGGDFDHSEVRAAQLLLERIGAELERHGWRLVRRHWNTHVERVEQ